MALLQIGDFDLAKQDLDFIDLIKTSNEVSEDSRLGENFFTRRTQLIFIPKFEQHSGGPAWAAGVTFDSYYDYLVYLDETYVVDRTATLPVVTAATPDANFIKLTSIYTDEIDFIFDKYNSNGLKKYTDILFETQADMQSLTLLNGNTATVEVGDALRVTESLEETTSYTVVASALAGDLLLSNGLFARPLVYSRDPSLGDPFRELNQDNDAMKDRQPEIVLKIDNDSNIAANTPFATIGQDGNVYWLDSAGSFMVKYNEKSNYYDKIALDNTEYSFWTGAVLAADGCIYSCPVTAPDNQKVSKLDTATGIATLIDVDLFLTNSSYNTSNGVIDDNGNVYFIGVNGGSDVCFIKVDTAAQTATYIDTGVAHGTFSTGCVAPNGKIYYAPITGTQFLELDPSTDTVSVFGTITSTLQSYHKMIVGYDGFIYAIPYRQTDIVRINPLNTASIDYNFLTLPNSSVGYPAVECAANGTDQKIFMSRRGNDPALVVVDLENISFKEYNDYDSYANADFGAMCINGNGSMINVGANVLVAIRNISDLQEWPKSAYTATS